MNPAPGRLAQLHGLGMPVALRGRCADGRVLVEYLRHRRGLNGGGLTGGDVYRAVDLDALLIPGWGRRQLAAAVDALPAIPLAAE